MKTLEEFAQLVKEKFEERYPGYRIVLQNVAKKTGIYLGLSITAPGTNLGTCLYMDAPYEIYQSTGKLTDIIDKMVETYEEHKPKNILFTKENIMANAMPRLCRRTETIDEYYHQDVLGTLSMIYYLPVDVPEGNGLIKLRPEHLKALDIDGEELHKAAMKNMIPDYKLINMGIMFILTNKQKIGGACQMFNVNVLNDILGTWNTDTLYIIPSSIHEVIIYAKEEDEENVIDSHNIAEVNKGIDPDEVLSNDLYKYTRERGLEIA